MPYRWSSGRLIGRRARKSDGSHIVMVAVIMAVIMLLINALLPVNGVAVQEKGKPKQKIVFCANQIYYAPSTGSNKCEELCSSYAKGIQEYMDKGWRVISSAPKEIIREEFKEGYIPSFRWGAAGEKVEPGRSYSYGCKCIGTEYIIEK